MKFTDGYWHMRKGLTAHFAVQLLDVDSHANEVSALLATRPHLGRGGAINHPALSLQLSAPMANVLRVRLWHHKGGLPRQPQFELFTDPKAQLSTEEDEQGLRATSGELSVYLHKGVDWGMDFYGNGQRLTGSADKAIGYIQTDEGENFIHEQLSLGVGENVYGLGERFTAFVKNGQSIEIWNEDGGTATEQAYKNIPFYLTNRGYGVFVNHPERVAFEVASEKVQRVQFSVPGEYLDYFLIYGPTPKEILSRYTALTGRPALPPAWSFGLWLSTSFTPDYDEAIVAGLIEGMRQREIPLSVFHYDCYWMNEHRLVDLEWDRTLFPDPEGMLKRLKADGLRICLWINPYVAQHSPLFDEGMRGGYFLKRKDGSVWQWDMWAAGMALIDFTNPEAARWYGDKLRALVKMGVDCFKTDFGERIPVEDVGYADGSDPERMHNYYAYLFTKTVFEVLRKERGEGEALIFGRSASVGSQQLPVHWSGDNSGAYESMAESLRGGLSLALSGFGFWSHDIGGFELDAPADVYKRWCAFGLLSSHSRLHGSHSHRVPWAFDDEAVEVLRFFTRLKLSLMPYLYKAALQAHQKGTPMLRAMLLEFPEDPACETLDRQYMLGDVLMVAPIFSADGWVSYYLPEGAWTHFLTGEVLQGPGWRREQHDFMSLPLLARPNSVIVTGAHDDRPDYDFADGLTLRLYEIVEGEQSIEIPALDGGVAAEFRVARAGTKVTVERLAGAPKAWKVLLVGERAAAKIRGGEVEENAQGLLVVMEGKATRLDIEL